MKKWNKRIWGLHGIGLFIARAVFLGMNPVGIGYFAALYRERIAGKITFLFLFLGIASRMIPLEMTKYGLILLSIMIVTGLAEGKGKRLSIAAMGGIAGLVTCLIEAGGTFLSYPQKTYNWYGIPEGVLVFTLTMVFHEGITYFLYRKKGQNPDNRQIISLTIIAAAVAYGCPALPGGTFSFVQTILLFIIMLFAYLFGAGGGAVAGAICGAIFSLQTGNMNLIGICCILGIVVGVLKELGKLAGAIAFTAVFLILGFTWDNILLETVQLRALASSVIIFAFLPTSLFGTSEQQEEKEESTALMGLQMITREKLREFSEAFRKMGETIQSIPNQDNNLERNEMDAIFEGISEKVCRGCSNSNQCLKLHYYDTYQAVSYILSEAEQNGTVIEENIPEQFYENCIQYRDFIAELNKKIELARQNLLWRNRLSENREVVAEQLKDLAGAIDTFSMELSETVKDNKEIESYIESRLRAMGIETGQITVMEQKENRKEIYMTARMEDGGCMTVKEAAGILSRIMGCQMKQTQGGKAVISKEFEAFSFVESPLFKVLTGVARQPKDGEEISGDNYSVLNMNIGKMALLLSDGMGSGTQAKEESETLVELLEQFMEAGMESEAAIKLIHSSMLLKQNSEIYSTIDLCTIDLYSGAGIFLKVGGAASFMVHGEIVEKISFPTLPVGMLRTLDYEETEKKFEDGDFIIMVTDGILDGMDEQEPEEVIRKIMKKRKGNNAKEIANNILEEALKKSNGKAADDMTVLVAGIWEMS